MVYLSSRVDGVAVIVPVNPCACFQIRPGGGDFIYDSDEIAIMKKDILVCKELGCAGIATGVQLPGGVTRMCHDSANPLADRFLAGDRERVGVAAVPQVRAAAALGVRWSDSATGKRCRMGWTSGTAPTG